MDNFRVPMLWRKICRFSASFRRSPICDKWKFPSLMLRRVWLQLYIGTSRVTLDFIKCSIESVKKKAKQHQIEHGGLLLHI